MKPADDHNTIIADCPCALVYVHMVLDKTVHVYKRRRATAKRERVRASDFPCYFIFFFFLLRKIVYTPLDVLCVVVCCALVYLSHSPASTFSPSIFNIFMFLFLEILALVFLHISCTTDARHHTLLLSLTEIYITNNFLSFAHSLRIIPISCVIAYTHHNSENFL